MPPMIARVALPLALVAASVAHAKPGPARTATEAALAKIKQMDDQLHAVIAVNPEALADADALDNEPTRRGPLHGVPVILKDNIATRGPMATTAGSLALAGVKAPHDAFLVARLRQAGAVLLGKANLSAWANLRSPTSSSGWSAIGGQTRNPTHSTARRAAPRRAPALQSPPRWHKWAWGPRPTGRSCARAR